jgi:hypothetical protein
MEGIAITRKLKGLITAGALAAGIIAAKPAVEAEWYLMKPPLNPRLQQANEPVWDSDAPLAQWRITKSFDSADQCEAEIAKNKDAASQVIAMQTDIKAKVRTWGVFTCGALR